MTSSVHSSASQSSAHLEAAAAGYSKTARRQYQSCDQCRKSRRACDAGTLRVANFPFGPDEGVGLPPATCEACSNCAKTSKKCTFQWLRSLPLQGLPKGVKRKLKLTGFPDPAVAQQVDVALETNVQSSHHVDPDDPVPALGTSLSPSEGVAVPLISHHHPTHGEKVDRQPTLTASDFDYPSYSGVAIAADQSGPYVVPVVPVVPDPIISQVAMNGAVAIPPTFHPTNANAITPSVPREDSDVSAGPQWRMPILHHYDTYSSSSSSMDTADSSQQARSRSIPTTDSFTSVSSDSGGENEHANVRARKQAKYPVPAAGNHRDTPSEVNGDSASLTSAHPRRRSTSSTLSSHGRRQQSSNPLSPRQVRFADGAMKTMIATGLLRIYHDSFENSLSCWVTERNCPYETELKDLLAQSSPGSPAEEAAFRLSDNRIFSRVSRLDSAFARLRGGDLRPSESRAASKALNAAIMAFASQWSHSSHNAFWRSKEGLSQMRAWQNTSNSTFPHARPQDPMLSGECERMIQKTLWHEARTAIQASAEVDSFKVILAYMIFALTQRPLDESRTSASGSHPPATSSRGATSARRGSDGSLSGGGTPAPFIDPVMDAMLDEDWDPFSTADLEALASPPIYLETAVRNLFSWRRKVERYRRMRSRSPADATRGSMPALALKDQQTFNILFWLAVMCDTTSSAISKRPLVIADEDCAIIREKLESVSLDDDASHGRRWSETNEAPGPGLGDDDDDGEDNRDDSGDLWGQYLLKYKWAGPRQTQPRWPCSFDEAALVLQEAIPVKVLMFRKVGQLQTLAYRRSAPGRLEQCIQEALDVYQHWNTTYGAFMLDCVGQHNGLPPHVQSWYVILDGHWHYGCLLLADAVTQIDREKKTLRAQRRLRASCGLIAELRRENAHAIARIAQASLSEHGPSYPDNPEFHFACNGSAILTEPWTDILVRAMGSACKVFIDWLRSWRHPADRMHDWVVAHAVYADLYSQAEVCIRGMSLLGRKSDAANHTAELFWDRLLHVCSHGQGGGDPKGGMVGTAN